MIAKLAQDPVIWFAGVLSTYFILLAVVLRMERAPWNRGTSLSIEKSKKSE